MRQKSFTSSTTIPLVVQSESHEPSFLCISAMGGRNFSPPLERTRFCSRQKERARHLCTKRKALQRQCAGVRAYIGNIIKKGPL